MVKINLLPWREQQRQQKNQLFLKQLMCSVLMSVLLGLAIWQVFANQLAAKQAANEYIITQTQVLDKQLGAVAKVQKIKEEVSQQMQVINTLQTGRTDLITLWEDVAKSVPKNVYLTQVSQDGDVLVLSGMVDAAHAANDIAIFIKRLKTCPIIETAAVRKIQKTNTQAGFNRFEVVVQRQPLVVLNHEPVINEATEVK